MIPPRSPSVLCNIPELGKIRLFYPSGLPQPSQVVKDLLKRKEIGDRVREIHKSLNHEDPVKKGIKYIRIKPDAILAHGHAGLAKWHQIPTTKKDES